MSSSFVKKFNWKRIQRNMSVVHLNKYYSWTNEYSYWCAGNFVDLDGNLPNYSIGVFEEKKVE